MRYTVIFAVLLLFTTAAFAGDEGGHVCPANRAAEAGFDAYETFHAVMAPLWHKAWPDKNYEALIAGGAEFEKQIDGIKELKPDIKSEERLATFTKRRDLLVKHVNAYVEAAKNGDGEKCYEILPELHDAFELSASALAPIRYPELTGLLVTSNIIVEQHIPDANDEGIKGSTETLTRKMKTLQETEIPKELHYREEALRKDFEELNKLVAMMQECCDKNDMEGYQKHAATLNERLVAVIDTHL
jgi:hypothetical protein